MERNPGRELRLSSPRPAQPFRWRVIGQYLPAILLAGAAFLVVREVKGGGAAPTSPSSTVQANHSQILADDIKFFEDRVQETHDSLSYNRLTGYYLQRLRETGDVSDVQRAELSAQKSLVAAPNDYNGLISLSLVKIAEHDFEAAGALVKQAQAIIPTRTDALAITGDVQMALGQYPQAIESYRQYLEKEPGFSAYSREAVVAETDGNVPLAEQFWNAAVDSDKELAPENAAWARVQLGNLYFTNGRIDEAKSQYSQSLQTYPGYSYAQAGLGNVAAARGDYATAIRYYTNATATIPQPVFVLALGEIYQRVGKTAEANREFALMAAIRQLFDANNVKNDFTLITYALDHGGDLPTALAAAKTAYEQRPSLQAADVYAWALYRSGDFGAARAKSDEALRTGIHDPNILFHAGMIALSQADKTAAQVYLQRAIDLNPNFSMLHAPEATAALKTLKDSK
jgi:tetratricopeptide (TPR) repeat protein